MDHHPPGLSPSAAWDYYYAHRDEKLDLILLSAYSTGVEPAELVPQSLYALQLRAVSGQAGQLGLGAGSMQAPCCWARTASSVACWGCCAGLCSACFDDTTISRVAREVQKRMLCVYNIWQVKTLQFQLTTSQKKRKLSEGLFIEEGDDEEVVAHDVDNYLDKLFTLLLAYAMAGCTGVTGAPEAAQELNLGSDTTKFVHGYRLQVLLQCQA